MNGTKDIDWEFVKFVAEFDGDDARGMVMFGSNAGSVIDLCRALRDCTPENVGEPT